MWKTLNKKNHKRNKKNSLYQKSVIRLGAITKKHNHHNSKITLSHT